MTLQEIEKEMRERGARFHVSAMANQIQLWADALKAERERIGDGCHHVSTCRCYEHINKALNEGDGVYRP